jgi:glycerophosphoryl diester phosphodiesterase
MGHAPENTLRGLRAGLALGVDGIEIDVQLSADGVPVLLHDNTLDRTTNGSGPLSAMAFAQLRELDAGDGEQVPTLREALAVVVPTALLVIEVKAAPDQAPDSVVDAVLSDVGGAAAKDRVWLWSFDAALLEALARQAPQLPVAHLCRSATHEVRARVERLGLAGVSIADVDESVVRDFRRQGLAVFCWTKNDPTDLARLVKLPLSGIVSDYPDRIQEALRGAAKES